MNSLLYNVKSAFADSVEEPGEESPKGDFTMISGDFSPPDCAVRAKGERCDEYA